MPYSPERESINSIIVFSVDIKKCNTVKCTDPGVAAALRSRYISLVLQKSLHHTRRCSSIAGCIQRRCHNHTACSFVRRDEFFFSVMLLLLNACQRLSKENIWFQSELLDRFTLAPCSTKRSTAFPVRPEPPVT